MRATLLVVLSACCFGSISTLTIIALEGGMSLPAIQAWRYSTTAVMLMAYAAWAARRTAVGAPALAPEGIEPDSAMRTSPMGPWYSLRTLLIAGGGQAIIATLVLMALKWIPAATEAFLFYTFPAWVAVITAVRGIEHIDRNRGIALLLALSGVAFMVGAPDTATLHPTGVILSLAGALVYAFYIPVLDSIQKSRPPIDVSRAIAVGGSLCFLAWALATGTLFEHLSVRPLTASILQGIVSAGAFVGFLAGLARLGAVRTAITSTVEPFFTAILGVAVLNQSVGLGTYVGGIAIMAAVLMLQRPVVARDRLHSSIAYEDSRPGRPHS